MIHTGLRHQILDTREKVVREALDGSGQFTVSSKIIHSWNSYGWSMCELPDSLFAGRIFDRFEYDEQAYKVPISVPNSSSLITPDETLWFSTILKKILLPWVRNLTRSSRGKWSVAADDTHPFPPRGLEFDVPLIFSFEDAEDAVKFKLMAPTLIL